MGGLAAPEALHDAHDFSEFDCGEPALNTWLQQRALKNESRYSRTYVVCDDAKVVAYASISAGSVERTGAPKKMRRNAPDNIPVSIIGRLAVSLSHKGQGLGRDLLSDALRRIASASRTIGIAAVLIHAKDDDAKAFYLSCAEFIEFPEDSRILFLPMETLVTTFSLVDALDE